MKEFEKAKNEYDNIVIPDELSDRVAGEIERAKVTQQKKRGRLKVISFIKSTVVAAAILVAVFCLGLNSNPIFAQAMENIPYIGALAKVLTFRQYEVNTDDYVIIVEIPTIEIISEDFSGLQETVNHKIHTLCEQYAQKSIENALEYRAAFLETGGTLEEWKEHDIRIKVSYSVQLKTDEYLSLMVKCTESWNRMSAVSETFNIDLQTGEEISLDEIMDKTGTVYYKDNYAVDAQAASEYAEKIKNAVAGRDIELLAELTGYPVYVGLDEALPINSKEDFVALGTEKIFKEELVISIAAADVSALKPSGAGFIISGGDSTANILFGVVDGQLKITGINY